jgi:hypothetical protein
MTWQPGQPVRTEQDHSDWQAWRRERKLQQQRQRRAQYPRIDYYPSDEAAKIIKGLSWPLSRDDLSTVINRMVTDWADQCHRNR